MNTQTKVSCFHCGEDCGKTPVRYDGKDFCCNGCKVVYDLLKDNKLYTYYELENSPGVKSNTLNTKGKYYYLDNVEIQEQILDFKQEEHCKITFHIPSIHCSSCIWLLENLERLNKGVISSVVNFPKKNLNVTFNNTKISLRQLAELLDSIYYAPAINFDSLKGTPKKHSNRNLLYKLGVSGFAFGNIMLLSFPGYFSSGENESSDVHLFFLWVMFILSLPVFFYSASEFFASAFKNLRKKIINVDLPVAIGIIALFSQSIFDLLVHQESGYFDSLAGLVFFLLIGRWYQNKTYESLSFDRDYKSYFPIAVQKVSGSGIQPVMLDKIVPEDVLQINNNELIPADGELIKGEALIDYSFVTGESNPLSIDIGAKIFAGGRQKGRSIQIRVKRNVSQSYLTQLWNQEGNKSNVKGISTLLDKTSRYFTLIVLIIATLALVFWYFHAPEKALFIFTSVLIVACPCALALSAPFGLGTALRLLGNKGLYLRNTEEIERLSRADGIVFDKTGTLTQVDKYDVLFEGKELDKNIRRNIALLCNQSAHPLSKAIANSLLAVEEIENEDNFSFIDIAGKGIKGVFGQSEIVLGSKIWLGENHVTMEKENNLSIDNPGYSSVYVAVDKVFAGAFKIKPLYRKNLTLLLNKLSGRYKLWVLSGDGPYEKYNLKKMFPNWEELWFNQNPTNKLEVIQELQKTPNNNVVMLGDGLNDAGALSEAYAGIAVTEDLRNFVPASDGILFAPKFNALNKYFIYAQKTMRLITISIVISLIYNIIGLYFAVSGQLSPILSAILMPLSSVTIVSFVSLTTLYTGKRLFSLKNGDSVI